MHQAGIKNLISMSPTPALYNDGSGTGRSAVDIWVLLPVMYNNSKTQVGEVLKKGDSVWSYNTLVQDAYSPKWLIDFDPVNFRIQPGFISQSLNLTGLLYWRVDKWPSDAWNNVNNAGTYSSANYPGEGMLVYPGQPVGVKGVVASMRLKWLRDGVEDYDYVQDPEGPRKSGTGDADLALRWTRLDQLDPRLGRHRGCPPEARRGNRSNHERVSLVGRDHAPPRTEVRPCTPLRSRLGSISEPARKGVPGPTPESLVPDRG